MASLEHRRRVLRFQEQQAEALKVRTFESPDEFFESVLGPRQHDAHVMRYRGAEWLRQKCAEYDLRAANVRRVCDEICARARAERGVSP